MKRRRNYDYYLIILTTLILFAIGLLCLYAIAYYNYLAADPQWTMTIQYNIYIETMNSYLYPLLLLLIVSLGLCIPKRLFEQEVLIEFNALLLGVTLILIYLSDFEKGLVFILVVMLIVQGLVVIMTIRKSKIVRFEKEGYVITLGSSLLHMGLVLLVLNFVILKESELHIPIFWIGTLLITAGNIFSFYPVKITSIFHAG
ncbi:MAG TPA: hypothetical protein VIO11_04005 [Candidatus Methanoperedens sp.]